jgi:hypothetical protein
VDQLITAELVEIPEVNSPEMTGALVPEPMYS